MSTNTQAKNDFIKSLTPAQRLFFDDVTDNVPNMVQDFQDICSFSENEACTAAFNVFEYEYTY